MVKHSIKYLFCYATILCFNANAGEITLTIGADHTKTIFTEDDSNVIDENSKISSAHFGLRAKKVFGSKRLNLLGTGVDFGKVGGFNYVGYRAIDYERILGNQLKVGTFIGAASIDSGLPQNGYYYGANLSFNYPKTKALSTILEFRYGRGLARDRILDSDPEGKERPDMFVDFSTISIALSWTL